MRACFPPSHVHGFGDAVARRRFAAALLMSVSAHVLLTSSVTPGSRGRSHSYPVAAPPPLAARLVAAEVLSSIAAPIEEDAPARRELVPQRPAREKKTPPNRADVSSAARAESAPASSVGFPDPNYYGARQLDVYPVLTGALDLRPDAKDVKGRVLLLVLIDATGMVDDASVVESDAPGPWDEAARRALLSARFKPALRSGGPVKSRLLVEIDYSSAEGTQ